MAHDYAIESLLRPAVELYTVYPPQSRAVISRIITRTIRTTLATNNPSRAGSDGSVIPTAFRASPASDAAMRSSTSAHKP